MLRVYLNHSHTTNYYGNGHTVYDIPANTSRKERLSPNSEMFASKYLENLRRNVSYKHSSSFKPSNTLY